MGDGYPSDWDERRKTVYQRDNYQCQNCGRRGGPHGNAELHAHHIVPKSKGGTHRLTNLKTMCSHCHSAIHGRRLAPTARTETTRSKTSRSIFDRRLGGCPMCEKSNKLEWMHSLLHPHIRCSSCKSRFTRQSWKNSIWKLTDGPEELVGTTLTQQEWKNMSQEEYSNNPCGNLAKAGLSSLAISILGLAGILIIANSLVFLAGNSTYGGQYWFVTILIVLVYLLIKVKG
ncbi:HNH endonuclease [Halorarius halobius]|uniref:HNH endonuclease n=1 Tax=Halorarius halobius TaxID=2962671 RepID=UPI0033133D19